MIKIGLKKTRMWAKLETRLDALSHPCRVWFDYICCHQRTLSDFYDQISEFFFWCINRYPIVSLRNFQPKIKGPFFFFFSKTYFHYPQTKEFIYIKGVEDKYIFSGSRIIIYKLVDILKNFRGFSFFGCLESLKDFNWIVLPGNIGMD